MCVCFLLVILTVIQPFSFSIVPGTAYLLLSQLPLTIVLNFGDTLKCLQKSQDFLSFPSQ